MWEVVRYSKLLIHASQCSDANCRLLSCRRIKRIITHIEICKIKAPNCLICNHMRAFYCYHAKYCQNAECLEPFCSSLKSKLKQEQPQRVQLLRRKIVVLKIRPKGQVGAIQSAHQSSNANMSAGVAMKPGMGPANLSSPYQSGIGSKPGTQTPPVHVFQVVKQVQEEAARQQASHVGYGKVIPDGGVDVGVGQGGSVMPPSQIQRSMPIEMPNTGFTYPISMDQSTPGYHSNAVIQQSPGFRQQTPQQLIQQQQQQTNFMWRVERSTELFFHACQCSDANCQLLSCRKIKRITAHIEVCRKKAPKCPICKIMRSFYYYHSKYCQKAECMAPFCSDLTSRSSNNFKKCNQSRGKWL